MALRAPSVPPLPPRLMSALVKLDPGSSENAKLRVSVLSALSVPEPERAITTVGAVVSMVMALLPSRTAGVASRTLLPTESCKTAVPALKAPAAAAMPPLASVSPAVTV